MVDYRTYDVTDFAKDSTFRSWVIDASPEETIFWERWVAENPDRQEVVNQARVLVLTVQQRFEDNLSQEEVRREIARLVRQVEQPSIDPEEESAKPVRSYRLLGWKIAASVILFIGLGWGYYQYQLFSKVPSTYHQLVSKAGRGLTERVNLKDQPMTVRLSDGSVVTLEKNSRISFAAPFAGDRREVYLTGEAFFVVTKNPQRPFLVYANETVTKVLGTGFRVRAFEKDRSVTVSVKSGRVSFYAAKEFEKIRTKDQSEVQGVVLTPNQRAVFNRNDGQLDKGLVDKPEVLAADLASKELVFEDRPVSEVLKTLEQNYGINIVFDEEILAHCPITTSFKEESLQQRLSVICQAIGATYEVIDGKIIMNCKSCKIESNPK